MIFDNYRIRRADPLNLVLEKKATIKTGKNTGQEKWELVGYYPRMSTALHVLVEKKVSDCESLKQILEAIDGLKKMIEVQV